MLSTLLSRKFAVATALAVAAWGAAGAAHARSDVVVSIGIHLPGVHVQTAPVHVLNAIAYKLSFPAAVGVTQLLVFKTKG